MDFKAFIIPISIIMTQVLKNYMPNKYAPLVSMAVGLLCGLGFAFHYNQDMFVLAFEGLIYGASASGFYDMGATAFKGGN